MRSDLLPPFYAASGMLLAVLLGMWSYFWASFPINDGLVGNMADADWLVHSLGSAAWSLALAALVGAAGWGVGVLAVRARTDDAQERRFGYREAAKVVLACGVLATTMGCAGALVFYMTRPIF